MKTYLRLAVIFLFAISIVGCGGSGNIPSATSVVPPATPTAPASPVTPAPSVSTWDGTYTGVLDFTGCSALPCTGDAITLTISDSADSSHPGQFLGTITASGNDATLSKSFTGNGTVLYTEAAPIGPGSESTNGALYLTNGYALFMSGTGTSTTATPLQIDTIDANSLTLVGVANTKGVTYYGRLARQ